MLEFVGARVCWEGEGRKREEGEGGKREEARATMSRRSALVSLSPI